MQPWVIDAGIVVLILGMAYALASEGAWGSCLMFFNVMFAGLIAFNFYEPLAVWFLSLGLAGSWGDFLALIGLFLVALVALRIGTDLMAPSMIRLPKAVYHLGRLVFSFAGAALMAGILLCVLETAPVHRKVFGQINYNSQPPYKMGLDRHWLAFVQYMTGNVFTNYNDEDRKKDPEFDTANAFDVQGSWLIDHQNARPYGEDGDKVPAPDAEAPAPAPPAEKPRG
jgi:uncharacterized membrane protein required for colicin V production